MSDGLCGLSMGDGGLEGEERVGRTSARMAGWIDAFSAAYGLLNARRGARSARLPLVCAITGRDSIGRVAQRTPACSATIEL